MARQLVRSSTQYVSATGLTFPGTFPLTTSAWIYPDTLPSAAWVNTADNSGQYLGIVTLNTGAIRAQMRDSDPASLCESAAGVVTTGSWQHVCGIFSANVTIYHNGTQVATASNSEGWTNPTVYYAGIGTGLTNPWDGRTAEHALWDVILNDAEVAALAKGASPLTIRPQNLYLYWPLWGIASTEIDLSDNGRNGTIQNSPALANHAPVGPRVPFAGSVGM